MIPQRLGDFEIIRELGRGGMGVVYEARQISLNRKVALKVLSGGLGLTPKAVDRFRREAEAAARLHHTNIVPIYATGEADGTHFYAMELIDGPSLDHVIREMFEASNAAERKDTVEPSGQPSGQTAPLARGADLAATGPYVDKSNAPADAASLTSSSLNSGGQYFDTVARMIADVADALEHAHQNGVIHRDIKPSNLLLSSTGRLSVNDFGLARMLEQAGMTMTGEFVGTPAYMSPEQITAGRAPLNHRTDIYSLGATLYELLTLRRPFKGERRDETIAQIMHKDPVAPRKVNAKVPVDLETICLKCLEKDPDRRYQTAGALAEDLRRFVNRFAISARRAGIGQRIVKWGRRHPALAGALACALLLAMIAALFAFQAREANSQLLAERRQHALEAAMAAAMGGNLDKAVRAISEAKASGASDAQIHMLRGLVAYFRGDTLAAVPDLVEAVKLAPENAAARGMLAMAYGTGGDWPSFDETMKGLHVLVPYTAEDFLFKGYAEAQLDIEQGLKTLDEGINRNDTPLARIVRAELRSYLAEDRADSNEAKKSLDDARAAKQFLPDNPHVLSISVVVQLVAANLYRAAKDIAKEQSALKEAEQDTKAIERWESLPQPGIARILYFERTNQDEMALAVAKKAAANSRAPLLAVACADILYRKMEWDNALAVLEPQRSIDTGCDCLRACILAEKHPNDLSFAHAAYAEMSKRYTSGSAALQPQNILRFLGDMDKAKEASLKLSEQGLVLPALSTDRYKRILNYYCEKITEQEYLDQVGNRSRWERSHAHFNIALTRLANRDREGARENFRQSLQGGLQSLSQWRLMKT